MGYHSLLQEIFPIQGSNLHLLHCRQMICSLSHQGRFYLKVKVKVAQSCPTLCDPMDYSLPGSSVHGIFQARVLKWVAISFSRGSSGPRDQTWVSCIVGRVFTVSAIEKSLAPTLLHPSFKGRTNRKPMALVKRAVLTCHHYQTSFL